MALIIAYSYVLLIRMPYNTSVAVSSGTVPAYTVNCVEEFFSDALTIQVPRIGSEMLIFMFLVQLLTITKPVS
jgi:hypothetical protein